jgi:hypothetical protein
MMADISCVAAGSSVAASRRVSRLNMRIQDRIADRQEDRRVKGLRARPHNQQNTAEAGQDRDPAACVQALAEPAGR